MNVCCAARGSALLSSAAFPGAGGVCRRPSDRYWLVSAAYDSSLESRSSGEGSLLGIPTVLSGKISNSRAKTVS